VLLDASTPVEREVLERWVNDARPNETPPDAVRTVNLPDSGADVNGSRLRALDETLNATDDPWLTPVRVVWRPVERNGRTEVHMRDVVLSLGDPRHPRIRWQRWLRSNPDRCRVVVGEPAQVSTLRKRWDGVSGEAPEPDRFTQYVARQATLALERAETQLVGKQYKVPRLVREELLANARFRSGLRTLAERLGRDQETVTSESTAYLEEMVTGWSRLLVDLGVRLGRYNFRRSYDPELDLDENQVAEIREAAQTKPLVFLPSHKSNLDGLVMTVALHDSGLPRTHIFGGTNMAFWPIGPIFQHSGTVFIRRRIGDNDVYKFTLREYIAYLLEKRFSLQFYIEGTRSRTGKLSPPRLGLMNYVVDAYRQGRIDDVVLIPVSIAYDQIQEVGDFAREARGANKSAESIGWLIRAFREGSGRFGKIYVRFGEPLSLRDGLEAAGPSSTEADERLALQKVAFEVSRRINAATPITATSLVTLSLLGAQGRALTLAQVVATVHDPLQYAISRHLPLAEHTELSSPEDIRQVLEELERHHVVMRYDEGAEPVFAIGPDQHLAAAFYRNTSIHFFLLGSIVQAALARAGQPGVEDPVATFWDAALSVRDLLKFEFFFEPREEFRAAIAAEVAMYDPEWEQHITTGPDAARDLLTSIRPFTAHSVLRSFLEAYGVVAAALVRHEADQLDEREFLAACLALGTQYRLQQRVASPESLSKPLFANGFKLAAAKGLLGADGDKDAQRCFLDELRQAVRDVVVVAELSTARVLSLISEEPMDPDAAQRLTF
jgi:glycerol-3-phosphate O-acyltransferase